MMFRSIKYFAMMLLLYTPLSWGYMTEKVSRVEQGAPEITYYLTEPTTPSYPIIIMIEGSSSLGRLKSVVHYHEASKNPFVDLGFGLITVESWGITNHSIDDETFWAHYTRSQRLSDHRRVIENLINNPPSKWDGRFVFWGGSEGGALATQLMLLYSSHTLATVNWIGAVDFTWEEQFWQFYEHQRARGEPVDEEIPREKNEYLALVEHIKENPVTNFYLGGMTYLYHADAYQQLPYDYHRMKTPLLVVTGTEDSIIYSSDMFVEKAQKAGAPITYLRVPEMGHEITGQVVEYTLDWLSDITEE